MPPDRHGSRGILRLHKWVDRLRNCWSVALLAGVYIFIGCSLKFTVRSFDFDGLVVTFSRSGRYIFSRETTRVIRDYVVILALLIKVEWRVALPSRTLRRSVHRLPMAAWRRLYEGVLLPPTPP